MTKTNRRRKAIEVESANGPFADPELVAAQWAELRACLVCGDEMRDTHRQVCSDDCSRAYARKRSKVLLANLKGGQ